MEKSILYIIILFLAHSVHSQSYSYDFSVDNAPYSNLQNSTSLNNGTFWDDPDYTIPIGFNFELADKTISSLYISGNVGSGNVVSTATSFNASDLGFLMIINVDLEDRGVEPNSNSNISYKTEGIPGSRIFKLEWNNAGSWSGSTQDYFNLQIWLHEDSNIVEYHYGPSSISDSSTTYESGNPEVLFIPSLNGTTEQLNTVAYILSDDPTNPNAIEVLPPADNFDEIVQPLNGDIPEGTIYRFSPDFLSVNKQKKEALKMYPNPASEYIAIYPVNKEYKASVYSSLGQKILETKINQDNSKIQISHLSNGIYFVEMSDISGKRIQKKFIKK